MASAPKARLTGEPTALRPAGVLSTTEPTPEQYGAARSLVGAFRTHGHLAARLDPLGTDPPGDPALEPSYHGLDQATLERVPAALLSVAVPGESAAEVLPRLREIYCGPIAYQIEHLSSHVQRRWLREAIESGRYAEPLHGAEQKQLLIRLARVEEFEHFLKRTYLGEKQFSIEGVDMLILMLDEAIAISAASGTREAVIGMAHRGRLNVLAHVLHRTYASILAEFEGRPASEVAADLPEGGFGDVKYHHGAHSEREIPVPVIGDDGIERLETRTIALSLMPNPSHLEFVNPVVSGKVRALQTDHTHSLAAARPQRGARHHHPRRRGLPRPGHRGGDAEPAVARRLLDGRHAAPDREQPGRVHDGSRGRALDAALVRSGEGLRHPDRPRQRRRHRGVPHGDAPRDGVPRALRARRADRPRRLPPLGPQRG